MHSASNFQLSIRIFTAVKLKNKNQGGKKGVFLPLFQYCISQWIDEMQASYLCRNNANYLVHHMCKNITITKIISVSKLRKSRVRLLGTVNGLGFTMRWRRRRKTMLLIDSWEKNGNSNCIDCHWWAGCIRWCWSKVWGTLPRPETDNPNRKVELVWWLTNWSCQLWSMSASGPNRNILSSLKVVFFKVVIAVII